MAVMQKVIRRELSVTFSLWRWLFADAVPISLHVDYWILESFGKNGKVGPCSDHKAGPSVLPYRTGLYILLPVVTVAALTEALSSSTITTGTMTYSRSLSSLTHEYIWFPWLPIGAPYQYTGAMSHCYISHTLEASSLASYMYAWNCFKEGHIVEYKSQRSQYKSQMSHTAPSWTILRRKRDRRKLDIRSSPDQACKLKPSTYARTYSRYHRSILHHGCSIMLDLSRIAFCAFVKE